LTRLVALPAIAASLLRKLGAPAALLAFGALSTLASPPALGADKTVRSDKNERTAASQAERKELERVRGRLEKLKKDLAATEGTRSEARDALRDSELSISSANRSLRLLGEQHDQARSELREAILQRQEIEAALGRRQDQLEQVLLARHQAGEPGPLKLLLSGQSPNRIARDLHYLSYLSRAEANVVNDLRAGISSLKLLETRSRERAAQLQELETRQREQRSQLVTLQATHRKTLDQLSERIREQRRQVEVMQRDESRLTRVIEEIGRILATRPPGGANRKANPGNDAANNRDKNSSDKSTRSGTARDSGAREANRSSMTGLAGTFEELRGSLKPPTRGNPVGRFGMPREGGGPAWKGLFFRAPGGQEVRAIAAGQVAFSDWLRGFGNLLVIDHGQGYLSIYGNNESLLKQVGDAVRAGDVVSTVGSSGGNPESGLYFEMRHEGKALDPAKWFSAR
jgi:septal ring factor EnvC (AmiA/AmiB activator)